MKDYLIRIESSNGSALFTTVYGDSSRPFSIAQNLWNYETPWTAAKRLEIIAKSWEKHGFTVRRIYGRPADMPTNGNEFNVAITLREYR